MYSSDYSAPWSTPSVSFSIPSQTSRLGWLSMTPLTIARSKYSAIKKVMDVAPSKPNKDFEGLRYTLQGVKSGGRLKFLTWLTKRTELGAHWGLPYFGTLLWVSIKRKLTVHLKGVASKAFGSRETISPD